MIDLVIATLAARGHDFRDYRRDLLERRIAARMELIGEDDPTAYADRVAASDEEAAQLAETILITTTRFFRHPSTFEAIERAAPAGPSRAWVAGVATGEEAWSLAMVLPDAEVLGSDASEHALACAHAARYPIADADAIPARHHHHLVRDRDHVTIAPALRARVRFTRHDLFGPGLAPADAVVARFDVVLCRNVLIYLTPRLQARLIDRLLAVLAPGGLLGLGPYESVARGELAPAGDALWRKR